MMVFTYNNCVTLNSIWNYSYIILFSGYILSQATIDPPSYSMLLLITGGINSCCFIILWGCLLFHGSSSILFCIYGGSKIYGRIGLSSSAIISGYGVNVFCMISIICCRCYIWYYMYVFLLLLCCCIVLCLPGFGGRQHTYPLSLLHHW